MKIIYTKKLPFKIIFLVLFLLGFASISLGKSVPTYKNITTKPGASIMAITSTMRLEWLPLSGKTVMVIVTPNNSDYSPNNEDLYFANETFGKGTACGEGFVVYRGTGNNVKLSGLTAGTTYYFSIYSVNSNGTFDKVTSQFFISEKKRVSGNGTETSKTSAAVVCPAVGGIVCTLNGSFSSGYSGGASPCNTGAFAGSNPWDGGSCAGFISFAFSAPVSGATIKMIAVNSSVDFTTISAAGGAGGALSLSAPSCMPTSGLVCGPYTGPGSYGDVSVKVNSTGTYTIVTCTNTGCSSGWVASCPTSIGVLAIELLSFTGDCKNENRVDLQWKTISEKNNDHFTIEKSKDLQSWQIAGIVQGAGTSLTVKDYSFTDKKAYGGVTYYRLKQTDFDGTFKYYETIAIDNCFAVTETTDIYPNPNNGSFLLQLNNASETTIIEIYNSGGEKVYEQKKSDNELKINENLPSGFYYLKVMEGNVLVSKQKIIIQN